MGAWHPAELARRLAAEGPYPSEADELRELADLVRGLAAEEGSTWAAGLSSTLAEAGGLAAARLYGAFGRRYLPFMAQLSTLDDDNLGVRVGSGGGGALGHEGVSAVCVVRGAQGEGAQGEATCVQTVKTMSSEHTCLLQVPWCFLPQRLVVTQRPCLPGTLLYLVLPSPGHPRRPGPGAGAAGPHTGGPAACHQPPVPRPPGGCPPLGHAAAAAARAGGLGGAAVARVHGVGAAAAGGGEVAARGRAAGEGQPGGGGGERPR
jgi:hypothetical protein